MALAHRQTRRPPAEPLKRQGFMKKAGQIYDQTVGRVRAKATFTEYEAAAVQAGRELGLLVLQQQLAHRVRTEVEGRSAETCPYCGRAAGVDGKAVPRELVSLTGAVQWARTVHRCPHCRRHFSPSGQFVGTGGGRLQPGAAGEDRGARRQPTVV